MSKMSFANALFILTINNMFSDLLVGFRSCRKFSRATQAHNK